jgi:hypothetical protein
MSLIEFTAWKRDKFHQLFKLEAGLAGVLADVDKH